jgi:hypothetical protein
MKSKICRKETAKKTRKGRKGISNVVVRKIRGKKEL